MKTKWVSGKSDFPNLRWPLRWRIRSFIRDVLVRLKILKPIDIQALMKKKYQEMVDSTYEN